jgi:hypothetical protein
VIGGNDVIRRLYDRTPPAHFAAGFIVNYSVRIEPFFDWDRLFVWFHEQWRKK